MDDLIHHKRNWLEFFSYSSVELSCQMSPILGILVISWINTESLADQSICQKVLYLEFPGLTSLMYTIKNI